MCPTRTNPCGELVIQLTPPCLLFSESIRNVVVHQPGAQMWVENHRYNGVLAENTPLLAPGCGFRSGYSYNWKTQCKEYNKLFIVSEQNLRHACLHMQKPQTSYDKVFLSFQIFGLKVHRPTHLYPCSSTGIFTDGVYIEQFSIFVSCHSNIHFEWQHITSCASVNLSVDFLKGIPVLSLFSLVQVSIQSRSLHILHIPPDFNGVLLF